MKLNAIESLVFSKFEAVEKEVEQPVIDWVTAKLQEFKTKSKAKKVKIISAMGYWSFNVDDKGLLDNIGVDLDDLDEKHKNKFKPLQEIHETLKLLAGERNIYLMKDIEI